MSWFDLELFLIILARNWFDRATPRDHSPIIVPHDPPRCQMIPPSIWASADDQTISVFKIDKWVDPVKILDYYQQTAPPP